MTIYRGKIDFSRAMDELVTFTAHSVWDDFSSHLNANESTDYLIPLDVPEAIDLEITPVALREEATLLISPQSGGLAFGFFPQMDVVNNQQNSVDKSVQNVDYNANGSPDFSNATNWFYTCRSTGVLRITGNFNCHSGSQAPDVNVYIIDNKGTIPYYVLSAGDSSFSTPEPGNNNGFHFNIIISTTVKVTVGQKLFLYVGGNVKGSSGIILGNSQFNLSYETSTPPSMCKAVPASYMFGKLLQAMNTDLKIVNDINQNQPVPFKSDLFSNGLKNLYFTCSDNIRSAEGTRFSPGKILFKGIYKVISGSVTYAGYTYTKDQTFIFDPNNLYFTGDGIVKKITSFLVGNVYNPGDTLQAGGSYMVGGDKGSTVMYNGETYAPGKIFDYYIGQDQFTGSNESSFVQQTRVAPMIVTSFKDFFQSIYSVQGGNVAFGIDYTDGKCFIETLDFAYRTKSSLVLNNTNSTDPGTINVVVSEQPVNTIDIGTVDVGIKIEPATELLYNSIKVGYKDQQYSRLNGYNEVNSEQTYTTVILNPQKQLNLVSPYRADPTGIEEIRATQQDTASSRSDNDTFMIWVKDQPENGLDFTYYHPLGAEGLKRIYGVTNGYYNWKLTPKHNLLRGGNYLVSIFYGMKDYKLTLSAALKNTAMVTVDLNDTTISEAAPVDISTFPDPLFIPIYVTIKPGLRAKVIDQIIKQPYSIILFTYNKKQYKAFWQSMVANIGQNAAQELKLLLTPDNDLTTLIH